MAKVLEGPGMGLMKKWGIAVPNYAVVASKDEFIKLAEANEWLKGSKLVAKAHEALGSRFKLGLVKVDLDLAGATDAVREMLGREVGSIKISQVIVSEMVPHKEEYYVAVKSTREGSEVLVANCGGIEALQVIKRECPSVRCLVLTMHDDQAFLQAVLDAGGLGYVTKEAVKQELIIAVRQVARGRQYISVGTDEGDETQADYRKQMALKAKGLSARERQVLSSVARGYTNKQIAEQLGVSKASVEQYRLRLSRKLGAKSRVDLVDYALQAGLLRPPKTS